jgi:hypothetical protein
MGVWSCKGYVAFPGVARELRIYQLELACVNENLGITTCSTQGTLLWQLWVLDNTHCDWPSLNPQSPDQNRTAISCLASSNPVGRATRDSREHLQENISSPCVETLQRDNSVWKPFCITSLCPPSQEDGYPRVHTSIHIYVPPVGVQVYMSPIWVLVLLVAS